MPNPNQLMAHGFRPYRKTTLTYARQMRKPFRIRIDTGEMIDGQPGDYVCISPDDGGKWIVARKVFEQTYVPASPKQVKRGAMQQRLDRHGFRPFRKHQVTWARKLNKPRPVRTLEGEVLAKAGDYLCIGPNGEQWPQEAHRFEAHYAPVAVHARSK